MRAKEAIGQAECAQGKQWLAEVEAGSGKGSRRAGAVSECGPRRRSARRNARKGSSGWAKSKREAVREAGGPGRYRNAGQGGDRPGGMRAREAVAGRSRSGKR